MKEREQMFVEAKRRYEYEKGIAERRGNRNVVSFDEWCETNDEMAKYATETASKMTEHIFDPKRAREMFDLIYGQCLVGLSGNKMYDCKQNKQK